VIGFGAAAEHIGQFADAAAAVDDAQARHALQGIADGMVLATIDILGGDDGNTLPMRSAGVARRVAVTTTSSLVSKAAAPPRSMRR